MASSFDSEHTLSPCVAEGGLPPTPEGGRPPLEVGEQGGQGPSLPSPGDPRSFPQRRRERTLTLKPKICLWRLSAQQRRPGVTGRGRRTGLRTHSDVHTGRGHAAAVVEVILDGEAGVAGIRVGHKGNRSPRLRCRTRTARQMPVALQPSSG